MGALGALLLAGAAAVFGMKTGACSPDFWLEDKTPSREKPVASGSAATSASGRAPSKKTPTTKGPLAGPPAQSVHLELGTPTDCLSCNNTCLYHDCEGGVCPEGEWSPCIDTASVSQGTTCRQVCMELGYENCVLGCWHGLYGGDMGSYSLVFFETPAECEADAPATFGFARPQPT